MKVLFLPEVSQQFVELAELLYDKGYLSFLDDAIEYSDSLFRQIQKERVSEILGWKISI